MASDNFPHDAAYKTFFSSPDMVKSLLLDFVPEDFIRDFDFTTLEKCSGSYTTVDLRQRHDDIVWRARFKDNWCYVYILLEFQSSQDYWMALRIATYTCLLWGELVNKGEVKIGEKLPPVLPIVLYNGENPWNAPLNIGDLVASAHSRLAKYQVRQEYFLLDENSISELLLDSVKGEAGYIFRFERAKDAESIIALYHEFLNRLSDKKYDFLRRAARAWLTRLMQRKSLVEQSAVDEPEEDNVMLEQKFRRWEQEFIRKGMLAGREEGREEGRAEGRIEGLAEGRIEGLAEGRIEGLAEGRIEGLAEGLHAQKTTLLEMLSKRFGEVPPGWLEIIDSLANPAIISQLTISMLGVNSPEEFGKLLQQPPLN